MAYMNIIGERFGLLTVRDQYRNEKGYLICLCECECGNMKEIHKSNITAHRTKSCGCLEEKNRRKFNDITDMSFGRLKAISPTDQRKDGNIIWECICECGETVYVTGRNLTRGFTKSCGCLSEEKRDITNQRFSHLIALYPDDASKKGRRKWICSCDCGNTCSVSISNLRNGHTRSCGCLHEIEYRTMIDGTCLELIASTKVPRDNRSGIKGVSYYSRTDSWVATLNFKGRHYYLGNHDTIIEAAKARWQAEDEILMPFIEENRHLLKE
ncbi:AP2 domain-containing protein [Desulforamulus aeronauticus]|uniref:AP2 domain-containing protein n=1 Tax=Desulforamulus aeronauticus DSM 10349 TaxID=1121421 RepID=A0A1M6VTJ3_9FIRM|nr:AP2 domain-containing protein [Desulforamulus aeronauticus]SHK84843.1 AP2 domain-containing protein [Desulforamulus aeronauticus DSM 10349]